MRGQAGFACACAQGSAVREHSQTRQRHGLARGCARARARAARLAAAGTRADPFLAPSPPPRYYHGRTGIVYNVAKRAVGVEVNKVIRNRVEKKRVNIRIEHIRPSKCRTDFLARVQRVDKIKRDAKAKGDKVDIKLIKRFPVAPKAGYVVKASESREAPKMQAAVAFDDML
jgi:large subunit ribosomal protein L21e